MVAALCPHCGQPLAAQLGSEPHDSTALEMHPPEGSGSAEPLPVVPDITAAGPTGVPAEAGATSSSRWRFVGLAIVATLVGLVVGSLLFGGGEDPVAEPAVDPGPAVDIAGTSGGDDPVAQPAADEVADPLDSVAELFRDWVDDDRSWAVVYPSPMGLQVLSQEGTTQPEIEVAVGFEEAARFPLISDGGTSWAVDPDALDTAYLVSTQFVVIDIDREGKVGFINDSLDPPNIGQSSFGAWGPGFDLPPGADVLAIPGRGLFVLPATGGTYQYERNGVVPFSDDVLVAASVDSEIYQRCDDTLACELYLLTPSVPEPLLLDVEVESELWPSPGGRWVVVTSTSGESWLHDVDSGVDQPIDGTVRAVDWAGDASMAAILTRDDLTVMRPDEADARSVTLPIAPSADAVLLVSE